MLYSAMSISYLLQTHTHTDTRVRIITLQRELYIARAVMNIQFWKPKFEFQRKMWKIGQTSFYYRYWEVRGFRLAQFMIAQLARNASPRGAQ